MARSYRISLFSVGIKRRGVFCRLNEEVFGEAVAARLRLRPFWIGR